MTPSARLVGEALASRHAWERLAELGDTFGHRLSGSRALEDAIDWAVEQMKKDGLENVRKEPVKVPHWVRGRESLQIVSPRVHDLVMLGLGNSVGTPPEGVEGELLIVRSFQELDAAGPRIKGKIVLFNVPFTNYGETVQFRGGGPVARRGARRGRGARARRRPSRAAHAAHRRAELRRRGRRRSRPLRSPPKTPTGCSAWSIVATALRLRLKMEAKFLPDADSFNVVGEIRGRERPDEVVVIGGHFDSWDVGTGSTDDGGGCVVTWEALRLMKKLNLRPRRTIRVVLWTNEENGLRGGNAYRDRYRDQLANHVLMLESDWRCLPADRVRIHRQRRRARASVRDIATLLRGIQADRIGPSGGGADIGPSVQAGNLPSMSLEVDGNYFLIHHTPADTVDKIDPMDMARASARHRGHDLRRR